MIPHYYPLLSWLILISVVIKLILCCSRSCLFTYRNGYSESGCLQRDQKPVWVCVFKCVCDVCRERKLVCFRDTPFLWTPQKYEPFLWWALLWFCFVSFLPCPSFLSVVSNVHFNGWEWWQKAFSIPWGMVAVSENALVLNYSEENERNPLFFFYFSSLPTPPTYIKIGISVVGERDWGFLLILNGIFFLPSFSLDWIFFSFSPFSSTPQILTRLWVPLLSTYFYKWIFCLDCLFIKRSLENI